MILFVVQLCQKILLIRYWQFPDLERLICRLCYREWLVKKKKAYSSMKKNEVDLCSIYGKFFTTYPGKGGAWLCSDFDEQHAFSNFLFSPFLASIHIRIAASQTGRKAHSFYIRPQTLSVVLHFERKTKFLSTDVLFTEPYLPPSPTPAVCICRQLSVSVKWL